MPVAPNHNHEGKLPVRKLLFILTILLAAVTGTARHAEATALTPDTGWTAATLLSNTDAASFSFTLTSKSYFSLTDCCAAGDIYTVVGSFTGVSSLGLAPFTGLPTGLGSFASTFDGNWLNVALSHFQTILLPGSYSIRVSGDGGGGFPSAFGVRLDTVKASPVPLPAALPLLLAALSGLGALGLRRRKA